MNILYIDPIFGISGDMTISAFIDAGMPFVEFEGLLKKIPMPVPAIIPERIMHGIIGGVHLNIEHSNIHLTIREMEDIIEKVEIETKIKEDAKAMLSIMLNAEAKVHGVSKDELHLHELSHIDTLIDLLGVAKGMHYFGIDRVFCGPVPQGRGTIKTSHGIIPNPPPVTLEILSGFSTVFLEEPLELTTPTGATIVRHYVRDRNIPPPAFKIDKIGYGAGTYKTDKPDVLRIFIGKSEEPAFEEEDVRVIETDIDDMEMEYIGAIADRIRSAGALDVLYFPVYMKKGRIGIRLSITTKIETLQRVTEMLFAETTTFGLRLRTEHRNVLRREEKLVETSYGTINVKYGYDGKGNLIKTHIEFEDVKKIAEEKGLPYRSVLEMLESEVRMKVAGNLVPA
ncbi:MAG: nickel pincer cofactor biosynthesis protein LarC [Proteobacteria bacterium]|nr:nickel pincer cofactor biosynthesis protein LarC [Pseudomonadota bacterium]